MAETVLDSLSMDVDDMENAGPAPTEAANVAVDPQEQERKLQSTKAVTGQSGVASWNMMVPYISYINNPKNSHNPIHGSTNAH